MANRYENRGYHPEEAEILFDSAHCVQKVATAAADAGLRMISNAENTHKSEFGSEFPTPREIAEKVKNLQM